MRTTLLTTFCILCVLGFGRIGQAQTLDLSLLFEEPTSAEIASVRADWNARDVQPYNWQTVGSGPLLGFTADVVSHTVSGDIHYGVVRHPLNYDPNGSHPILIVNHGGTSGTSVASVNPFSQNGCFDSFFIIAPSFSGEPLNTASLGLGTLTSEGEISEFDGDIDDVLALLNGTIANYSGAEAGNINVFGGSRGAGVSYLMSVRDSRIRRAVYFFGATDHMTYPGLETDLDSATGPFYNTIRTVADDYMAGNLSLADARAALLSRSTIHFINSLPSNIQIHHGDQDLAVPVENSRLIDEALTNRNLPTGSYSYFEYPGGGHGMLPDSITRRDEFLCVATTVAPLTHVYIPFVGKPY